MRISKRHGHKSRSVHRASTVVEDTVEYYCDEEQVSGELAWTAVQALSAGKLLLLKGAVKIA